MKRRTLIKSLAGAIPAMSLSKMLMAEHFFNKSKVDEIISAGSLQPTWDSLKKYQVPDWFRNAKFGIWAHWGLQCQPEHGDWYARSIYMEGSDDCREYMNS